MSDAHGWQTHRLALADHTMTWHEVGRGPTVLFLHGSYDHVLCRPMLELFADRFRCVVHDQRGTEASPLPAHTDETLDARKFIEDVEALRRHLGLDRLALVGHSWGATLGLLYGGAFPQRIERLALIGAGPVNQEMRAVYRANVRRMIPPECLDEWDRLSEQYRVVVDGDQVPEDVDRLHIHFWSRIMVCQSRQAERFAEDYLRAGGQRRRAPNSRRFRHEDALDAARRITAPVVVMYGYQDYEPITQGYLLRECMPHARLVFLNECGHLVWLDQPEAFRRELLAFLEA